MIDPISVALSAGALSLILSFLVGRRPGKGIVSANTSEENVRPVMGVYPFGNELPAIGLIVLLLFAFFLFISESLCQSIFFLVGSTAELIFTGGLLVFFSADLQLKPAGNDRRAVIRSGSKLGFFTGGFALLSLGGLCLWIPAHEPESWIIFGFGVSMISLIRICLNQQASSMHQSDETAKSSPQVGRQWFLFRNNLVKSSEEGGARFPGRIVLYLSDLYAASILSFCILMAASGFIEGQLYDWNLIAPLMASAGLAASVLGIGLSYVLGGKCRGPVAAVTGALYAGAAFFILKDAANGITTQALAEMGMLDRLGPFWSVLTGIITSLLTHMLLRYYRTGPGGTEEKKRYLFGKAERIYIPFFFPLVGVWIAYELAGSYGIVLSAAGAAGVVTFLITMDRGEAASAGEISGRTSFFTALRESSGSASFFVAAGCLGLIALYAAEMGTTFDGGTLNILGMVVGIGLGAVYPFVMRKLGKGVYWQKAVLPIFTVLAVVSLIGGLLGIPALLGFLAATLCAGAAYLFFELYRVHTEPYAEEVFPDAALAKTAASAALVLLPLIVLIYESIH